MPDSPVLDLIFRIPFSFSYLFLPDAWPLGHLEHSRLFFPLVVAVSLIFFFHKEKPLKHQASSGKGKIKRHLESYCRNLSSIVKQVKTGSLVPAVLEVCWTAARYGGLFAIWPYASTFRGQPESWIKTGYDLWSHFSGSLFFFSSFFFFKIFGYPVVWFFRPVGLRGIYLGFRHDASYSLPSGRVI